MHFNTFPRALSREALEFPYSIRVLCHPRLEDSGHDQSRAKNGKAPEMGNKTYFAENRGLRGLFLRGRQENGKFFWVAKSR